MAESNQTTFSAPGRTGADQNILNKLNSTGQNPFSDLTLFNSNRVDKIMSDYNANNPEKVTGLQVSTANLPNSSQSSIDLANMVFKLNDQTYNTNAQNITTQENKALGTLTQNVKDQSSQALQLFGQSSLLSSDQSSRNRSYVTDIGVQGQKAAMDIQNQAQTQLSQLALGYAQNNVNAFTQARQLDLQDKQSKQQQDQFDFNKAVTEAGLTGNYNGNRTMQGIQFDQNTINTKLQQALSLSSLTGKLPDLTNISPDLQNQLNYQNNSTTPLTLSGQSSQIGLEGAKAQLLQTRANLGLDTKGLSSSLLPAGADSTFNFANTPAGKLQAAQLAESLSTSQVNQALNEYKLKSYAGLTGVSGPIANTLTQAKTISDQLNTLLKSPNPDSKQVESLYSQYFSLNKQISDYQGSGNGIYYNANGVTTLDKNGIPTIDYSNTKYIPGSIASKGLDGSAQLSSPTNPDLDAKLQPIQKDFAGELFNAIKSGDSSNGINKIFYGSNDGNKAMIALRQLGDNGKPNGSYQFQELDMSGMSAVDKAKLQNAITTGTTYDGQNTGNTKEGLQNLQNIITSYSNDTAKLKINNLYAPDVIDKLKTSSDYNQVANNIIYNDGKTQLNNSQLLPMVLLGATPGGGNLIKNDFGGVGIGAMLTNYNTFYNQAAKQGISTDVLNKFAGDPANNTALSDGTPNPFVAKDNAAARNSLQTWYDSMVTQSDKGQANQYFRALVSSFSSINGGQISDSYIDALFNPKSGGTPLQMLNLNNL